MIVILIHLIITKEKGTETYDYSDDGDDSSCVTLSNGKAPTRSPEGEKIGLNSLQGRRSADMFAK